MCDKYNSIKAWRNLLYVVIVGDLAYIKMQYDAMIKSMPRQQKSKPTIEPVDDVSRPNASTTPQEGKSIESIPVYTPQCQDGYCPVAPTTPENPKTENKDPVKTDATDAHRVSEESDVESIPEYEPEKDKNHEDNKEDDKVEDVEEEDADEKKEDK
jgi:hypothetical protein